MSTRKCWKDSPKWKSRLNLGESLQGIQLTLFSISTFPVLLLCQNYRHAYKAPLRCIGPEGLFVRSASLDSRKKVRTHHAADDQSPAGRTNEWWAEQRTRSPNFGTPSKPCSALSYYRIGNHDWNHPHVLSCTNTTSSAPCGRVMVVGAVTAWHENGCKTGLAACSRPFDLLFLGRDDRYMRVRCMWTGWGGCDVTLAKSQPGLTFINIHAVRRQLAASKAFPGCSDTKC